jgi:hypothetical protein
MIQVTPRQSSKYPRQTQQKGRLAILEAIDFAVTAAAYAYGEVIIGSAREDAALCAARDAYRVNLPKLESRTATQAYISTVALGMEMGFISVSEGRQMIWTACLRLASDQHEVMED